MMKIKLNVFLYTILASISVLAVRSQATPQENCETKVFVPQRLQQHETWVIGGNPGSGKSTFTNRMMEELVAEAGVSIGSGLTTETAFYAQGKYNITIADTPGLDDIDIREQAASEIEKAFKKGGLVRFFAVITLENGRIKSSDRTTIKTILESIPLDEKNVHYTIVVNQINARTMKALKDEKSYARLKASLAVIGFHNYEFIFLEEDNRIADGINGALPFTDAQLEAIFSTKTMCIDPTTLKPIDGSSWEEKIRISDQAVKDAEKMFLASKEKMEELQREAERMREKISQQTGKKDC